MPESVELVHTNLGKVAKRELRFSLRIRAVPNGGAMGWVGDKPVKICGLIIGILVLVPFSFYTR